MICPRCGITTDGVELVAGVNVPFCPACVASPRHPATQRDGSNSHPTCNTPPPVPKAGKSRQRKKP